MYTTQFINNNKYNCALYFKLHTATDSYKMLLLFVCFFFAEPMYLLVAFGNNWWMSVVWTWMLTDICIYVNQQDNRETIKT